MPAKKKRTRTMPTVTLRKKTLDALRLLGEDYEPYVAKAEGWRKRMEAAEALLTSGEETMREHAKVVIELNEKLALKDKELSSYLAEIRELAAEGEWWRGEAENLRSELLALIRDEARRAKPVAEES